MRDAFMDELINAARIRDDIVLIIGDLGYSVIEPFADEFPCRFFNAGIAEQNMMGMAAGMASEGMRVFTYSIGNFPTWRCAEQIRNDIDYHNLPVTNVMVGGGVIYGSLGYSHHAVQDYAIMRSLPNMNIASPGDPLETRGLMRKILNDSAPYYLRLGKSGEPRYHKNIPEINLGELLEVSIKREDSIIISTGATLDYAVKMRNRIFPDYSVYSMPLWGMRSKEEIRRIAASKQHIITVEDHLLDGGFGSWMLEAIDRNSTPELLVEHRYLSDEVCGMVGKQTVLNQVNGLG